MKNARDIAQSLLPHIGPQHEEGSAFAPANIALVKYWGKRDEALNLPLTDSLSLSLKTHGTTTRIRIIEESQDRFFLNGARVPPESDFYRRTHEFLNLFRHQENFEMHTESNIPIAAGLASSASGFAALVLALDDLCGWQLPKEKLSVLARLGSGSACRSFWPHWVKWQKGERDDGLDSHGI
ncbi:MAG: diphosphomevalonate decarboxylase, partial [Gammaproteobacteria bacterium]|nr:diphosphomevalonate decarboxylase [Gammaproteobacteria bacterium]